MFGYIIPRFDHLDESQRERYRSLYCGVCRDLKQFSGHTGRITLSHDMTFLAILLNSLDEPEERTELFHCPVHPVSRQKMIRSTASHYAAAMNLLLMYYKCEDKIRDEGSVSGRFEKKLLTNVTERIRKEYPRQFLQISSALEEIWTQENKPDPDPDLLCNLSGEMLGAAFVPDEKSFWAPFLRGMGEGLGRFVYWMDAWDDLSRDRKHHRFNPLYHFENREDLEEFVHAVLEMMLGDAADFFEMLPLKKDLDLMRNVLYSGVWQCFEAMQVRREKGRKR